MAADWPAAERPETSYTPLYDPVRDGHPIVPPLDRARETARKVLDEKGRVNIHDQDAMIRAAYGLHHVLLDLLAALDREEGKR